MINKISIVIILFLLAQTVVFGQQESHVVYERQDFKITSPDRGGLKVSIKYYIDSEARRELGMIILSEDKYTIIKNLKGVVLSPDGKVCRKIKKSDIMTYEGSASYYMYTDNKYQGVYLSYPNFPYYIECSFELDFESLMFWPQWSPQRSFEVKEASYSLQVPEGFGWGMRRFGKNIDSTYVAKENKIIWKVTNIPAWSREYRMSAEDQDTLGILFAPQKFSIDNTTGNLITWDGLGSWYRKLSHKQNDLSDKDLIPLAIDTTQSTKEIIRQAYRFIQKNMHYYAVTPGIYGWKPHPSSSVLKNRYGDCKDLATLLTGILKVYNIPSYPGILLIRDYGVVDADFPINRFDHVIAYVPLESETLWVDCTTTNNILENIPSADEGASALVVLDDTTCFTTIPESKPEANRSIFQADITVGVTGNAQIYGSLTFIGDEDKYFRDHLGSMDDRERKELLIS